jgi:TonB-dependent Receptor Plug Domain
VGNNGIPIVTVRGISSWNAPSAIFLVDGIVIQRPHEIVNPQNVIRLEVLSGARAAIYGSAAGNGVIVIYTRRFGNPTDPASIATQTQSVRLRGFQSPQLFYLPDYDALKSLEHDNRQTLYWNPELILLPNRPAITLRFFTSDQSGDYQIVVAGKSSVGPVLVMQKFKVE